MNKTITEIEADLYKALANKTLGFGCKYDSGTHGVKICIAVDYKDVYHKWSWCSSGDGPYDDLDEIKIIGHEPTIRSIILKLESFHSISIETNIHSKMRIFTTKIGGWEQSHVTIDLTRSFDKQSEEMKRDLHALIYTK